jgi:Xaa-Pro aminopeptidase
MLTSAKRTSPAIPFDSERLDRLMDEAGIDVLLATSKHNAQYLLGGHRAFFFDYMDAMGLSRYLPVVIYPKGAPDKAGYVGHRLERFQQDVRPLWTPVVEASSNGSVDAIEKAVDHIRRAGLKPRRIGVEMEFLPADSAMKLTRW